MNTRRIKHFLRSIGCSNVEALQQLDYFSNDNTNRQIYTIKDQLVVKAYGQSELKAFEIERAFGQLKAHDKIATPDLLGYLNGSKEAYLAYDIAKGMVLNDLYQELNYEEYGDMVLALGKAMRSLHKVPLASLPNLPVIAGNSPNHLAISKQRWKNRWQILSHASEGKLMKESAKETIQQFLEQCAKQVFTSELVLSHTDIHNENAFYDTESQSFSIIDWETVAAQPKELDFVHPLLNILGEGFKGRRLYTDHENEIHPFAKHFEKGYGEKIDWEPVAAHAMLWYLEKALEMNQKDQESNWQFFRNTAFGALEFVGVKGII